MQSATAGLALPLERCSTAPVSLVGTKAKQLGRAINAGLPVPSGVVLATPAYQCWAAKPDADSDNQDPTLPDTVELSQILSDLGPGPFAVRSSSPAEDLATSSFAGQYVTTLDVSGPGSLMSAVEATWKSASNSAARAYAGEQPGSPPGMAVIIQHMVPAAAAGVAFTADPVTGDRTTTVVDAVAGLGERFVSGEATPEQWEVRGGSARQRSAANTAHILREDMVLAIAGIAAACAELLGTPADIEWALGAGGELHLLQMRPITALPDVEDGLQPPSPGYWQLDKSHFPRPVSAMGAALAMKWGSTSIPVVCSSLGLLVESIEFARIGGWNYMHVRPLGGKEVTSAPPLHIMWLAVRLHPVLRRRVRSGVKAVRSGKPLAILREWRQDGREEFRAQIAELNAVDPAGLDDRELEGHLKRLYELSRRGWHSHAMMHAATLCVLGRLVFMAKDMIGWEDNKTLNLLAGLSPTSTAPARKLDELAARAALQPELKEAIVNGTVMDLSSLDACSSVFAQEVRDYLREYGCRPLGYDVADPTLEEKPEYVIALVADRLRDGTAKSPTLPVTATELEPELAALPRRKRKQLQAALDDAREIYWVREDNVFYTICTPIGLIRRAVLEIGKRLAAHGRIPAPEDLFHLEIEDAMLALSSGKDFQETAMRGRSELERAAATIPRPYYGTPPTAPPLAALPRESRLIHKSFNWYMESLADKNPALAGGRDIKATAADDELSGTAASSGIYTGRVRIITDDAQVDLIQPGEVVVTAFASPAWSLVFPRMGALIADEGGVLSHSAIIAREYRVPAVVGVRTATDTFRDGQIVRVDGTSGTIRVRTLSGA